MRLSPFLNLCDDEKLKKLQWKNLIEEVQKYFTTSHQNEQSESDHRKCFRVKFYSMLELTCQTCHVTFLRKCVWPIPAFLNKNIFIATGPDFWVIKAIFIHLQTQLWSVILPCCTKSFLHAMYDVLVGNICWMEIWPWQRNFMQQLNHFDKV